MSFAFSSYSGYEWEGIAPSPLHPTCSTKGCSVDFKDKAYVYRIDALIRPIKREDKFETARFLAQTTFGASKSILKEFESKYTKSMWRVDEYVVHIYIYLQIESHTNDAHIPTKCYIFLF